MKPQLYALLLLALPGLALVPPAAADGAGLSGQCYSEDGSQGGEDEVRADTQSGVEAGLQPLPGDHGITDGLALFVLGTIADGGQTGTACDRYDCFAAPDVCAANGQDARFDYLEVDATVLGTTVQACYRGQVSLAGDCPKHPTGVGQ